MKEIFKTPLTLSCQKCKTLCELNRQKYILKEILFWFGKTPFNPNTYRKIWNLMKKLPSDDIPCYKDGFFYFDSPESPQAIQYPYSSMKKDYKGFISLEIPNPKELTKDSTIPYFQCLYWACTDMLKIHKFVHKRLSEVEGQISALFLNW